MREHAIPQDVTGYRFHIIGNMTLKQFVELATGCVLGLVIYSTNLPMIIKWPMITMAVALGAMAAFVPIEERPFDHWIVTFFKTLYKPTKFYWTRQSKLPDPFLYNPVQSNTTLEIEVDLKPARRQRIKEYLSTMPVASGSQLYDDAELAKMRELLNLFDQTPVITLAETTVISERPDLKVRVRSFRPQASTIQEVSDSTLSSPVPTPITSLQPENNQPTQQLNVTELPIAQVGQQITIPDTRNIAVDHQQTTATDEQSISVTLDERAYVNTQTSPTTYIPTQEVVQNLSLPFPAPPTEPNKVVGMALTPNDELLNDTIVEITTTEGQVARAVKTNALGQFFITTPLPNGSYTVMAEKDGYTFAPLSLSISGQLVAPLEIRSLDVVATNTSAPIESTATTPTVVV